MTDPDRQAQRIFPELAGKTLLICVGAMKAGTSWLYHTLATLPEVAVSPLKEVHFFNAKFPAHALSDVNAMAVARLGHHIGRDGDPTRNLRGSATYRASVDRVQMIYADDAYFGHFARLCAPETRVICDVTPAYAVIGADGFAWMKAFCAAQDVRLKVLYVLRDPVDRLWSQLRQMQQINPENDALAKWPEALESERVTRRADYKMTIKALDATLPGHDILYLFYETLFAEPALRQLSNFLGVAYRPGPFATKRNQTTVDLPLPDDARAAFLRRLAPQYAFCRQRFGERVPTAWARG